MEKYHSVLLKEIRNPVEGLQIILMLYFHVPIEILLDKQPEIITKHFKPAILRECMSTLFNGKMMHQLPRDWLPEMHFPIARGMKWYISQQTGCQEAGSEIRGLHKTLSDTQPNLNDYVIPQKKQRAKGFLSSVTAIAERTDGNQLALFSFCEYPSQCRPSFSLAALPLPLYSVCLPLIITI